MSTEVTVRFKCDACDKFIELHMVTDSEPPEEWFRVTILAENQIRTMIDMYLYACSKECVVSLLRKAADGVE
jgi:hypothetical protein